MSDCNALIAKLTKALLDPDVSVPHNDTVETTHDDPPSAKVSPLSVAVHSVNGIICPLKGGVETGRHITTILKNGARLLGAIDIKVKYRQNREVECVHPDGAGIYTDGAWAYIASTNEVERDCRSNKTPLQVDVSVINGIVCPHIDGVALGRLESNLYVHNRTGILNASLDIHNEFEQDPSAPPMFPHVVPILDPEGYEKALNAYGVPPPSSLLVVVVVVVVVVVDVALVVADAVLTVAGVAINHFLMSSSTYTKTITIERFFIGNSLCIREITDDIYHQMIKTTITSSVGETLYFVDVVNKTQIQQCPQSLGVFHGFPEPNEEEPTDEEESMKE
ncbi:hypothetical protein GEMRC1_012731 [Eukaryota sp. GEM-RC1]